MPLKAMTPQRPPNCWPVQHHLVDRGAVRLWPAAAGQARAAIVLERQLLTDRGDYHLAAANRLTRADLPHLPLAMAPHGLGQRRLEARLDMLGVDEAHRQPAGKASRKAFTASGPPSEAASSQT